MKNIKKSKLLWKLIIHTVSEDFLSLKLNWSTDRFTIRIDINWYLKMMCYISE